MRKVDDHRIDSTAQEIDWKTTAVKWETNVGQRFAFRCPAGGQVGKVYGDGQYSTMSSVCSAAVHAARISAVDGGAVVVRMIGVTDVGKEGMTRAGVKSRQRNGRYPGFVFE
jgi:LCCL domain